MVLLVLNIPFDCLFVDADGGYKVASRPKSARWELFGLFLNPRRRLSFEDLNYVGDGILRWNAKMEVDMLITDVPSAKS